MEYRLVVEYEGFSREHDSRIESIVGRESGGSGFGMGTRDLDFYFKQRPAAENALKRVKRIRKFGTKATLYKESKEPA